MNERFEALSLKSKDPLERFTVDERKTVKDRLDILSSLAYLIGKDYEMQVEVNPDQGWHWDFEKNVVRADPDDLLHKPIEFLRFVMSHEAGHRRISRVFGVVPDEVWKLPGFAFLMNAIEDPRDNNFVADNVPHFKNEMEFAYGAESDEAKFETEMKEKANTRFGKSPRFMQAGFEYIKLWYKVVNGEDATVSEGLPQDVREIVLKTLDAAMRSWNTYPSLQEVNEGVVYRGKKLSPEQTIVEYAKISFEINYKDIWPLFKTLIDKDIEDARKQNKSKGEKVSEEDLQKSIEEFARELAEHLEGENIKSEAKKGQVSKKSDKRESGHNSSEPQKVSAQGQSVLDDERMGQLREKFEGRGQLETLYQMVLREHASLIDHLTNELQEIFNKRRHTRWESGYKSGKKIHIGKAIREEVRETSPFETGVFMRREQSQETDYVITLLVDLSGSMRGEKIKEAYKTAVVLLEVLNQIGIQFSVVGFNRTLHDFKEFNRPLDDTIREETSKMLSEVFSSNSGYNNDGWALDQVSANIKRREESEKIIFVVSDGVPAPSRGYESYDLKNAVKKVISEDKIKVIGLGLGEGTGHVQRYYPNSVANINVEDLAKVLGSKLREAIEQKA